MPTVLLPLEIDESLKADLDEEAARGRRSTSQLAEQAIRDLVEDRRAWRNMLREAVEEADMGVFISWEKVQAWMRSWGTSNELPPPEPDIFPEKK
jgi:predicted transcriptional regulator